MYQISLTYDFYHNCLSKGFRDSLFIALLLPHNIFL